MEGRRRCRRGTCGWRVHASKGPLPQAWLLSRASKTTGGGGRGAGRLTRAPASRSDGEGGWADAFGRSRACFEEVIAALADPAGGRLTHAQMEEQLTALSRELVRTLDQDFLDLRAAREEHRDRLTGSDQVARGIVEQGHERTVATVFGEVTVTRMAYGRRGAANLYPADAVLNLPPVKQSLGLARAGGGRGAAGVLRSGGRGDHARHRRADRQAPAGATRGRRRSRCERVLRRAPARAQRQRCRAGDDLRRERRGHAPRGVARGHRRGGCGQPAEAGHPAVPGGKNGRKRMAELGCVYDRVPVPRTAADIIARSGKDPAWARPPRAARPRRPASG